MSISDDRARAESAEAALRGLERAVERALKRVSHLEGALESSRGRRDEVEALLSRMADGDENPARMHHRIQKLESENSDLRRRIDEGREGVERLLAKIRFLEEQR